MLRSMNGLKPMSRLFWGLGMVLGMLTLFGMSKHLKAAEATSGLAGQVASEPDKAPVAGATIYYGPLISEGKPAWWLSNPISDAIPHVTADENGNYEISGMNPGHYHLFAVANGFKGQHKAINLKPGDTRTRNFNLVPLPPEGLAGITGVVTDTETSAPLAGAQVFYKYLADDTVTTPMLQKFDEDRWFRGSVVTDTTGTYTISNLAGGVYHVQAVAAGYKAESKIVAVPSTGTVVADFALTPGVQGQGNVTGMVIDALTTQPVVGARVWVVPSGGIFEDDDTTGIILSRTETDSQGNFTLGGVPAGDVRIFVHKPHYKMLRENVTVQPGGTTDVVFQLQPFAGQFHGTLAGVVKNGETDELIQGALVTLEPVDELAFNLSQAPDSRLTQVTDKNGEFVMRNVPRGAYTATAAKGDFVAEEKMIQIDDNESTIVTFLLEAAPAPQFGELSGKVVDADTQLPVAGAWVRLGENDEKWLGNHAGRVRVTDNQGQFSFGAVETGPIRVQAIARHYGDAETTAVIVADEETTVTLALPRTTTVGAVEGTVTDSLTGEPVVNALVFIPPTTSAYNASENNAFHTRTDAQGHYLLNNIAVGQRLVVAIRPHYKPQRLVVEVNQNETAALNIALEPRTGPTEDLEIEAINGITGEPMYGVQLEVPVDDLLEPGSAWNPWSGKTNANGLVTLSDLPVNEDWNLIGRVSGFNAIFSNQSEIIGENGTTNGTRRITLTFVPDENQPASASDWQMYQ